MTITLEDCLMLNSYINCIVIAELFDTNARFKEILNKKQISYESSFFELFKYFDDDNAIQVELLSIIKQYDEDFNKLFESRFNNN